MGHDKSLFIQVWPSFFWKRRRAGTHILDLCPSTLYHFTNYGLLASETGRNRIHRVAIKTRKFSYAHRQATTNWVAKSDTDVFSYNSGNNKLKVKVLANVRLMYLADKALACRTWDWVSGGLYKSGNYKGSTLEISVLGRDPSCPLLAFVVCQQSLIFLDRQLQLPVSVSVVLWNSSFVSLFKFPCVYKNTIHTELGTF